MIFSIAEQISHRLSNHDAGSGGRAAHRDARPASAFQRARSSPSETEVDAEIDGIGTLSVRIQPPLL